MEGNPRLDQEFLIQPVLHNHMALAEGLLLGSHNDGGMAVPVPMDPNGVFSPAQAVQRRDHFELVGRECQGRLAGLALSTLQAQDVAVAGASGLGLLFLPIPDEQRQVGIGVGIETFALVVVVVRQAEILLMLRAVELLVRVLDSLADLIDEYGDSVVCNVDASLPLLVEGDPLGAPHGLDNAVDEECHDADGDQDNESHDEGDTTKPFSKYFGQGILLPAMGRNVLDRVDGVQDDILVALDVVDAYFGQIREGICLGNGGGIVDGASIVDDIGVEHATLELSQSFVEDGVSVGQDGQQRATGVAELVDGEELTARGGQCSRAQDVPQVVCRTVQRGSHTEEGASKGSEGHALEVVQDALCVQQADGIACDESSQAVAHHAYFFDLATAALDGLHFLLYFETHSFAAEFDAIVGEGAAISLGAQNVELVGGVGSTQGFGNTGHVVWVSPQLCPESGSSISDDVYSTYVVLGTGKSACRWMMDQGQGEDQGQGLLQCRTKDQAKTYAVNQDDEVVSLCSTAGVISHDVVVEADQGPVDGAEGKGQQFGGGLLRGVSAGAVANHR